jgi:hypothetical protein
MNRRYFITLVSSVFGIVPAGISFAAAPTISQSSLNKSTFNQAQKSIHAAFGSRFRLVSARAKETELHCTIEHFGNELQVSSTDLIDWRIDAASTM